MHAVRLRSGGEQVTTRMRSGGGVRALSGYQLEDGRLAGGGRARTVGAVDGCPAREVLAVEEEIQAASPADAHGGRLGVIASQPVVARYFVRQGEHG